MAAVMGIDFKYVHADLEFQGAQFKDVVVRYKGNSTSTTSWPVSWPLPVDLPALAEEVVAELGAAGREDQVESAPGPSWATLS